MSDLTTSNKTRALNMLQSAFLADAATMPLHWIYDVEKLHRLVGTRSPLFFSAVSCPFYTYPEGELSAYGYPCMPVLQSIAEEGQFDFAKASEALYSFFKRYGDAEVHGYEGYVGYGPKKFIELRESGKDWAECATDDAKAHGLTKVPILVGRYAGSTSILKEKVREMILTMQLPEITIDGCVLFAIILEKILFSSSSDSLPSDSIREIYANSELHELNTQQKNMLEYALFSEKQAEYARLAKAFERLPSSQKVDLYFIAQLNIKILTKTMDTGDVLQALDQIIATEEDVSSIISDLRSLFIAIPTEEPIDVKKLAQAFGISCSLPGAVINALMVIMHTSSFEEAVSLNIMVGGDNCGRSMVIGAAFGMHWESKRFAELTTKLQPGVWEKIIELSTKVVDDNEILR